MSQILQGNVVAKLHAAADAASRRGFSGELYDYAAREIERLRLLLDSDRRDTCQNCIVIASLKKQARSLDVAWRTIDVLERQIRMLNARLARASVGLTDGTGTKPAETGAAEGPGVPAHPVPAVRYVKLCCAESCDHYYRYDGPCPRANVGGRSDG